MDADALALQKAGESYQSDSDEEDAELAAQEHADLEAAEELLNGLDENDVYATPREELAPAASFLPDDYADPWGCFIEPAALAQRLQSEEELVVVDVRDEDALGGSIRGAVHCPSDGFAEGLPKVCETVRWRPGCTVVFLCMTSQIRGRLCAGRFVQGFTKEAVSYTHLTLPTKRIV
eukprot:TRINITY_DN2150_c0_g1_i5.p1 TRINITY_DN2150_c0_g1~~TRINITY_DN2150_c0_g1_i5.p1  ORF type:complete len:177 (-),score=39.28 TRINITY_DN2150_c0_g1_i5:102-632(-)